MLHYLRSAIQSRSRLVWLGFAFVLLVAIAVASGVVSRSTLGIARQALSDQDETKALRWLSITQTIDPRNAHAEAILARIDLRHDRFAEADAHLKKALSFGLDSKVADREKMLAQAQAGRLEGIESSLNAWLAEADPGDRRVICEAYANGLAIQARFADAIRLLNAWKLDFPTDPEPDYRLGRIDEHLRQKPDAEKHYRESLKKDPNYYPAAYSLGRVLLDRKDAEEALVYFRKCLELPHPVAAQVGMGSCLKALGKVDEARKLFEQAAHASKAERVASYRAVGELTERFVAAVELGKLETELGNHEEGEQWLRKAVEADPRDSVARYAWAVALRGLGERDKAEEQFEFVRTARKALDEAGKLHDRIDQHPDDVEARYRLGAILLEHDSERAGLYWLGTALSYDPQHAATHRALSNYFRSQDGVLPDALALAEKHGQLAERYAADAPASTPVE